MFNEFHRTQDQGENICRNKGLVKTVLTTLFRLKYLASKFGRTLTPFCKGLGKTDDLVHIKYILVMTIAFQIESFDNIHCHEEAPR